MIMIGELDMPLRTIIYIYIIFINYLFLQTIDAATKEQADEQPTIQQDDEEAEKLKPDEETAMDVDEELEVNYTCT